MELCTIPRPQGFKWQWDYWRIFGKLKDEAGFWTWPNDEQKAVARFLKCWWEATLAVPPEEAGDSAAGVLEGIGCLYEDIVPFLSTWSNDNSQSALRHFVDSQSFLPGFGWSKEPIQQLRKWLSDTKTMTWLEQGYLQYAKEPWADELALAVDSLSLAISTDTLMVEHD